MARRLTLAWLLLVGFAHADEVKVRVDRPSELVITTDSAGKITVTVKPLGPQPNPPAPDPDNPTPEPIDPPTPGPDLSGIAKIAYDAAIPLKRPSEARTIAGLYRGTASKLVALPSADPQPLLNELGKQTTQALGVAAETWKPVIQTISKSLASSPARTSAEVADVLRQVATGLEAAATVGSKP